jgi:hypothetical protein
MTIEIRDPELEALIREQLNAGGFRDVEDMLLRVLTAKTPAAGYTARREAVRRMQEFGDRHRLSLGEPVTRDLIHEGHRH